MALDDIPSHLLALPHHDKLKVYLRLLPISIRDKRYIYLAWCKRFAYNFTKRDIEEVIS